PPPRTLHPFSSIYCSRPHPHLHSFPTRRSSDLNSLPCSRCRLLPPHSPRLVQESSHLITIHPFARPTTSSGTSTANGSTKPKSLDRKSTRLNSSHVSISYAVFCLKKKKTRKSSS